MKNSINLRLEWVGTKDQLADEPSRTLSKTENRTRRRFVHAIRCVTTLDVFATPENTVCPRFISQYDYDQQVSSRYWLFVLTCFYQVHKDSMSYMPRRLDYLYVYPPPCLVQGAADHLVRNSRKSVYLHHVFDHANVKEAVLNDLHEFRILVGNRKYAFTECPCKGNDKRRRG